MSIEKPDADWLEQLRPAYEVQDDEDVEPGERMDADQLDYADQHRSVPLDDELER